MTSMDENEDFPDAQQAGMALIDAFHERDEARFRTLSPEQREAQFQARQELYTYVDDMWEEAKAAGLNPALRPEWKGVAGMRDVLTDLRDTAGFLVDEES
ncbi:hypothetical protein [Streptomyces sp. SID3343]|uniref:hypothetical protein n=1 Tax=Streptomyces sp. SID3343 TaxID=2690260 RepID=UPI0013698CE7|nr:hypothetical protein [Streptomyces sp. SID3343]MYW01711.1 hypothetical protein [Streptomyces sp. SID3343]